MELTRVKLFAEMGRGIVARVNINAQEIGYPIMECEILVLNERDTKIVNQSELKHYTFKYNDTQDCLVLGDGEIFNHSDTPNVGYQLIDFMENGEIRKKMMFYLLKSVKAGEQLFINYNDGMKVDTQEYINSKSMLE